MGKLSPEVTDEGAIDLPNGAIEKPRWGDGRESPLFYKERLGTGSPPHPTRLRRPTFPKGEGFRTVKRWWAVSLSIFHKKYFPA